MMEKHAVFTKEEWKTQVETMLRQWNLPGLSLAVVKDGEVILTEGYGMRDNAAELPMNAKTMLPIGSTTKSFTALVLGTLVDEEILSWDTPVKTYIPWLKLWDPMVTERVTVRDLMCHRTGLPSHDVHGVFCAKDDRKKMVEDLEYLQPSQDFRVKLQYQNQMVMLAGYVAETLTGKSWEELVKERILNPLGMHHTNTSTQELEAYEEISKGYLFNGKENIETPYLSLRGVGPAGAVNSTAEDMAKYLLFQLGDGTWDGKTIISRQNLDEMHTAQMLGSPYFWKLDEITETNYGMGWFVDRYRGHRMLSHGGNTLGFSALMTLMPEQSFGIIAMGNANSNFMVYALTYAVLDKLLGAGEQDWSGKMQAAVGEVFAQMGAAAKAKEEARIPDTTPSLPLEAFAGIYTHPAFGRLELQVQDGTLTGSLNEYQALASHYQYDTFDITLPLMGVVFSADFLIGEDGQAESISARVEPAVDPVIFKREALSD